MKNHEIAQELRQLKDTNCENWYKKMDSLINYFKGRNHEETIELFNSTHKIDNEYNTK